MENMRHIIIILISLIVVLLVCTWMIIISNTQTPEPKRDRSPIISHSARKLMNLTRTKIHPNFCRPNPCHNEGECHQTSTDFTCECAGTGYGGAVCYTPKYALSCAGISTEQRIVNTMIDLDGSGPLKPFPISCQFYENDYFTATLMHSLPGIYKVDGYQEPGSFHQIINYDADPLEVITMVDRASACWQRLMYYCKNSKLFNSTVNDYEFRPFSWWVSRNNQPMDFWAGGQPGSRKCACGMHMSCRDQTKSCNCDADQTEWTEDGGYIRFKEFLPVTAVRFGDTGTLSDEKEGQYKVGPLRCLGDNLYNKIIHNVTLDLPPFIMGPTADIYLEFKTSASDGVLYHAIGPTDYIKLSIIDGIKLQFECNGGEEPLILDVEMPYDFDDTRWHTVRVERNRKEVQLIVDGSLTAEKPNTLPGFSLQLTSNFTIGGTINKTNGYVGSMRTLMISGVLIDIPKYATRLFSVN